MHSSRVMYWFGRCSCGRPMFSPIVRPRASEAPRLAASMIPGPPPEQTMKRRDLAGHRVVQGIARQIACFRIITTQWTILAQSGGAKENDRVADSLSPKDLKRLEVFGQNSERPCVLTIQKALVQIRDSVTASVFHCVLRHGSIRSENARRRC